MMNKYQDFTKQERERMFTGVVEHIGEIRTTGGLGAECNRRVRICKNMPVGHFRESCNHAHSELLCIGTIVNLFADHVLRETIQRLKTDGSYKQETKKICNELQGVLLSWKTEVKSLLAERYEPMEDSATDRQSEIYSHFETLRMQVVQHLLRLKNKHVETASWVEMTQQMFVLSHLVVKNIVLTWYKEEGIDFSDVFSHMDLFNKCSKKWQKVCMKFYTYDQQVAIVQNDKNFENGLKIFSLEICNFEGIYKHFRTALDEHSEAFNEEDREKLKADLEDFAAEREEERKAAEKANADYWAKTKRTAKPRASDITEEDIQQLKEHFRI